MDKLFRQVSVKERLPEMPGRYFTSFGECTFSPHTKKWLFMLDDSTNYVDWWLEEVELPSDDEILEYARDEQGLEDYDIEQDVFIDGANYILNKLKGEKR